MDLYRQQLLDHYHRPRGWGLKAGIKPTQAGYNPLCGDQVTVQVELVDDQVSAMRFEGHGCVISLAAASLLSEHVMNKKASAVRHLGLNDMKQLLGIALPPARVKCGLLALETLQLCLSS